MSSFTVDVESPGKISEPQPSRCTGCNKWFKYGGIFLFGGLVGISSVVIYLWQIGLIGGIRDPPSSSFLDIGILPNPRFSVGRSHVEFTVYPVTEAQGYTVSELVLSAQVNGGQWTVRKKVDFDALNAIIIRDEGLEPESDTVYKYHLLFKDGRMSSSSFGMLIKTQSAIVPSPPELFLHSTTSESISFTWSFEEDPLIEFGSEITGYTIIIDDGEPVLAGPSENGYALRGLGENQRVNVKLLAENSVGKSLVIEENFKTNRRDALPPGAPTDFNVIESRWGYLNIGWTAGLDNGAGILDYQVLAGTEGENTIEFSVVECEAVFTDLTPGKEYIFTIKARNAQGLSPDSLISDAVLSSCNCVPDTPVQVSVQYSWIDAIGISWEFAHPRVCPSPILRTVVIHSESRQELCTAEGNINYCDILGLSIGDIVTFKVLSINSSGQGGESAAIRYQVQPFEKVESDAAPYQGHCANRNDGRYFVQAGPYNPQNFIKIVSICATKTVPTFGSKTRNCIIKQTKNPMNKPFPGHGDLSENCGDCFAANSYCVFRNCGVTCGKNMYSPECLTCNSQYCKDPFYKCSRAGLHSPILPDPRP